MLPAQILLLNFVSDIPMLAIPTDNVAEDELRRPHEWSIPRISNFMYFFGTISSLADYAMFAAFLFVAHTGTDLFRSGWFLGSMLTELVVIFLLRTRRLSIQNPPSAPLLAASLLALLGTVVILQTPVGGVFGLVPLPAPIIAIVVAIVIGYVILTELGKTAYAKFRNASA
jgi:Mg2+-importing ATPase